METMMTKTKYVNIDGEYFEREFLVNAQKHLDKMIPIWLAGMDKPNPAEQLAFMILQKHSVINNEGDENENVS
jgi:hypothetical protein